MPKNSPPFSVLVVDDEPLMRWSVDETLTACGCDVTEAGDGRDTLDAVRRASRSFDVILLDLHLPDSRDLSLLASLRVLSPGARIILMTAFGTPQVDVNALALGAFCVLSKPFEMRDIAALVAQARALR